MNFDKDQFKDYLDQFEHLYINENYTDIKYIDELMLDQLIENARLINSCLGNKIRGFFKDTKKSINDILIAEPKEAPRCLEKMKIDDDKNIKLKCLNLKDISRSSIIVDNIKDYIFTFNKLKQKLEDDEDCHILEIKNMFSKDDTKYQYADIKIIFK